MKAGQSLPLADAAALAGPARRAAAARLVLAAAAVVLAAVAYTAVHGGSVAAAAARPDVGTVAVLDVSGSISDRGSNQIQHALGTLIARAGPGGRIGLVLFSDVGVEALPPTAPTSALQRYRRYFIPLKRRQSPSEDTTWAYSSVAGYGLVSRLLSYPQSPWGLSFSGGTTISAGLAEARASLRRAGIRRGRVVLLSDLIDSPLDSAGLRRELAAYAADPGLELDVRALATELPQPLALYRKVLGRDAVRPARIGPPPPLTVDGRSSRLPLWPIALAAAAAALLAANELLNAPLRWRLGEEVAR